MGMNIKSEEVHALARQLAEKTGTTMTGAIRTALENELMRLKAAELDRKADRERKFRDLMVFLDHRPPPPPGATSDHSEFYDDDGMPL